jgi:hypothetical protein
MKFITAKLIVFTTLLLSATIAYSGVAGFLTKETRDWNFVQSVGGMKVSLKETGLIVECDVSGVKKVTVDPTMVNSALGVRTNESGRLWN